MSMSELEGFKSRDRLEDLVIDAGGWERLVETGYYASPPPVGVKVVESFLDEGTEDGRWDSPHDQGHEGTCFVVLEFEGRFFRKVGTTDSYAKRGWNGRFREVKKGEVQVVKFEWTEG